VEKVRKWIFEQGYSVASKSVEAILGKFSWTSTRVGFIFISYLGELILF
jgi:hypothetical protein